VSNRLTPGAHSRQTCDIGEADLCLIALTDTRASADKHSASRHILPLWHGARHAFSLIESVRLAERLTKEWLFRRDGASRATCTTAPSNRTSDWSSVWKRLAAGFAGPSSRGDELIKIASDGIGELRQYESI
jgi:hypothetical protein